MKKKIFFLFCLFFCNIAFTNTIFESNKLNNIDYLEKIKNLYNFDFSTYSKNRIFLMYAYDNISVGKNNNIQCNKLNFNIKKFKLLIDSLKKYDLKFLNKNNINYIVLCEKLKINNYLAAGFANNGVSTLIIDFSINKNMIERTIHHEIFHMIASNYNTKILNESWKNQNNNNFIYRKCNDCKFNYSTELSTNLSGFLSEYSKYSINEDQAEVFSFWMSDANLLQKISEEDKIIIKKINILKNFLFEIGFQLNNDK